MTTFSAVISGLFVTSAASVQQSIGWSFVIFAVGVAIGWAGIEVAGRFEDRKRARKAVQENERE